jgi:hypothetical protein
MHIAKTLSVTAILLVSTLGITAIEPPPLPPIQYVGLGHQCGFINNINYWCEPETDLNCQIMPGASIPTCVYISSLGGTCNPLYHMCIPSLTCVYPPGQTWDGVCQAVNETSTPTPTQYVGLANKCGLIGGVDNQCLPGLTCDIMPGARYKTCIYISSVGGTCNRDYTRCAEGLTCVYPYDGAWHGVCQA